MHIGDSPAEAAYRAQARAWLAEHAEARKPGPSAMAEMHHDLEAHTKRGREWQAVLAEGGWAGITWPKEFGGRGESAIQAAIFAEEQAKFDVATGAFSVAIGMVGPTLIAHGTPQQQARFLPAMLRGDEVWCQLFSEPGAGSDLAGLGTRAELDGDTWVVNGQKVWTSLGQFSDWGILLARTNPDAPKHSGITYFLVDMTTPGIDVRPLKQITGTSHFNEVFLSDVRIPKQNVVGQVNEGWRIAHTTLTNERALIGGSSQWTTGQLADLARRFGRADDPVIRQDIARAHIRASLLSYLGFRLRTAMSQGTTPGPEALTMKLAYARHMAATGELLMAIQGAAGTMWGDDAVDDNEWNQRFVGQYSVRIGGGTDEIQQNIIAERGLGLPREPTPDKGMPWRDTVKA